LENIHNISSHYTLSIEGEGGNKHATEITSRTEKKDGKENKASMRHICSHNNGYPRTVNYKAALGISESEK
jgi:hypothetical protein